MKPTPFSFRSVLLLFSLLLCLICTGLQPALAQQQQIDPAWKAPSNLQHPYLLFSDSDKPAILERIRQDPESRDIMAELLVEGNRLMYTPIGEIPAEQPNPRYDSDGKYNRYVGECREAMMTLSFLYQMTGEERYAQKAYEFTQALCVLPHWIIKAHEFSIIYDRVWPWNALLRDDQVVFSYDIRTGDIASEMGIAYDWLYPALNKMQKDRIRGALLEKAILCARHNYDYQWWATSYKCNWNGICFSGLGISSLALLTEDPSLADVAAETYQRIGLFLDNLGEDGGWQEGRGYWAYGMRACVFYMEAMKRVSGGTYDLFQHKRLQDHPVDFALYGLTGYFGDGSGKVVGSTHLINKLTTETGNTDAAWYREHMMKEGKSMFDIVWPRPQVASRPPAVASRYFRSIDWAFLRSDFTDPAAVTLATKAGYNDDPHHGHLDIGHVSLWWHNEFFLTDHGSGRYTYDEKYFNEARWTYPQASSAGHNVVFVNGELQLSAKHKNQPWQEGVGGKILEFRPQPDRDYVVMDPSHAYPQKELKKWRRNIVLDKPAVTLILDEVESESGAAIEARFHPGVKFDIHPQFTLLTGAQGDVMALIPVCEAPVQLQAGRHPYLPVRKEAVFQWIPYFGSRVIAQSSRTMLATLLVPVANLAEAEAIARSARIGSGKQSALSITFTHKGTRYDYSFEKTEEGLLLKR